MKTSDELQKTEPALAESILQHGKLFYLAPGADVSLRDLIPQRPITIFCYDTTELSQKKRLQLVYAIYGHRQKIRGKVYESEGMLKKYGGERIGKATIIVPSEHRETFEQLLDDVGAKFRELNVFGKP